MTRLNAALRAVIIYLLICCISPVAALAQGGAPPQVAPTKESFIETPTKKDAEELFRRGQWTDCDPAYGCGKDVDPLYHYSWPARSPPEGAPDASAEPVRQSTTIEFLRGSGMVRPEDVVKVEPYAAVLREDPTRRLVVVGHTDSTGTPAINIPLSRRRAEAVKRLLVSLGAKPQQIEVRGNGSADPNPEYPNNDPRQRRVEFEGL